MISVTPYIPRMKWPPEDYQVEGTHEIVNKPCFFIADKPGSGKSKQAIDAACILYENGVIDTVLIVCPAQAKISWFDDDFGEIVKHSFVPSLVCEFTSKRPMIPHSPNELVWAVVSYEFGRGELYERMLLTELSGRKVMVVFDESIRLANWKALQHKVYKRIAHQRGDKIVVMNGTPGDPVDVYGQFEILNPAIIGCKNYYHFEARYCIKVPIKPGSPIKVIKEFCNKDMLDARIKPFILRREPPVGVRRIDQTVNVALTPKTWKLYKQMRDSLLADLNKRQVTASNAMVKGIRLAQLTSGLLGGVEDAPQTLLDLGGDYVSEYDNLRPADGDDAVVLVGDEKTDGLLEWLAARTKDNAQALRVLVWCRFRPEIFQLERRLQAEGYATGLIVGGQKKTDREASVREFTQGSIDKPFVMIGQQQAGGMALNFITCHYTVYKSNMFSYRDREQTEMRTMRKGQLHDCIYTDMIATGPDGQKTIDHHIVKSLRNQESVATWTMEDWRRRLEDE